MKTQVIKTALWIPQLVCVAILLPEAWGKLTSQAGAIYVFSALEMEPAGRYVIGAIELLATAFLLSRRFAAAGSLLAVGTMLGALLAHFTVLGISLLGDEGRHLISLTTVLVCAGIVTLARRHELPLIGSSFEE